MLEDLTIKDFAIIESEHIEFSKGFTVLSGETGAGKSIIIGAVSFLLGGKAEISQIRAGCHEASVCGTFVIPQKGAASEWLSEHGIEPENDRILLRRFVRDTGKSGAWIGAVPVTRTDLADFSAFLVDIHGQHDHQSLMRVPEHRKFLDARAGITEEVSAFTGLYTAIVEKRKLLAGCALDVCKVYENALGGLGAQVAGAAGVLGHADGGFEHEIELADGGKIMLAADGADYVLVGGDELVHLVEAHGVDVDLGMLLTDELVGAVAGLAGLAVEQGIGEAGHMAGGDPGLGVHDDGGVQTHVVGALLNEFLEPGLLDVVLELNAEGAVVPGVCKTAVDLAARVHEAAVFAQCNDLVHGFFAVFHSSTSFPEAGMPRR